MRILSTKCYLLCLGCAVLFTQCKKDGVPQSDKGQNPIYNIPIEVAIEGLQDITMQQSDTADLLLLVKYISGTKEKVSVAVTGGVEEGITVGFFPQIDTPDYHTVFRVITTAADTGVHTLTFTAAAEKSSKDYSLQLTVTPSPVNHAQLLAGSYVEEGTCSGKGSVSNPVTVTGVSGSGIRINLMGLWIGNNHYEADAILDPANQTLMIPQQQNKGMIFSGSGEYNMTTIRIDYIVQDGLVVNEQCQTVLTRQ